MGNIVNQSMADLFQIGSSIATALKPFGYELIGFWFGVSLFLSMIELLKTGRMFFFVNICLKTFFAFLILTNMLTIANVLSDIAEYPLKKLGVVDTIVGTYLDSIAEIAKKVPQNIPAKDEKVSKPPDVGLNSDLDTSNLTENEDWYANLSTGNWVKKGAGKILGGVKKTATSFIFGHSNWSVTGVVVNLAHLTNMCAIFAVCAVRSFAIAILVALGPLIIPCLALHPYGEKIFWSYVKNFIAYLLWPVLIVLILKLANAYFAVVHAEEDYWSVVMSLVYLFLVAWCVMWVPKKVGAIIHGTDQGDVESIAATGATLQTIHALKAGARKTGSYGVQGGAAGGRAAHNVGRNLYNKVKGN